MLGFSTVPLPTTLTLTRSVDDRNRGESQATANQSAEGGEHQGFNEKLTEDVTAAGPNRLAQSDF